MQAVFPLVLLVLLTITTAVLQFTSTILLTYVRGGLLLSAETSSSQQVGMNSTGLLQNINYWASTPTIFAKFIEYTEPAKSQEDVADTGVSVRGFLPFSNATLRSDLRSHTGTAVLLDTRVICARPNITFSSVGYSVMDAIDAMFQLNGTMSSNPTLPN
jgi:hypothetical protein